MGEQADRHAQRRRDGGIRARADDKTCCLLRLARAAERRRSERRGSHVLRGVHHDDGGGGGEGEEKRKVGARTLYVLGFDGVEGNVGLPAQVLRQLGEHVGGFEWRRYRHADGGQQPQRGREESQDEWVAGDDAAAAAAVAVPQQQAATTDAAAASIVGGVVGGAGRDGVPQAPAQGHVLQAPAQISRFQGVRWISVRHLRRQTKKHKSIQY